MTTELTDKQVATVLAHKGLLHLIDASCYLTHAYATLVDSDEDDGARNTAITALYALEGVIRIAGQKTVVELFGEDFAAYFFDSAVEQVSDDAKESIPAMLKFLAEHPDVVPVMDTPGSYVIPMSDDELEADDDPDS